MQTHWALSIIIGIPILVIIVAIFITLGFVLLRYRQTTDYTDELELAGQYGAWGTALIIIIISLIAYFPYSAQYHQWRVVSGKAQQVSSRLISNGSSGMSQRYVIKINGQPYGVDDTRASLVKVGDHVQLQCKRDYQWFSVPGWTCRWDM